MNREYAQLSVTLARNMRGGGKLLDLLISVGLQGFRMHLVEGGKLGVTQVRILVVKVAFDHHVEWTVENLIVEAVNQLEHNVADFGFRITLMLKFGDMIGNGTNSMFSGLCCGSESLVSANLTGFILNNDMLKFVGYQVGSHRF